MIAIATSTRADWGLLTPLAKELISEGAELAILASNMHLMPEMGMTVTEIEKEGFKPIELHTAGANPEETFAKTTIEYGQWFAENHPAAVVILGDRYEMLAVATAAVINTVPIIHIAGGTVSEGAIDNAIRNAISQLATLHFAETELCAQRLKDMGIASDKIEVTGALGVWNALNEPLMKREELAESLSSDLPKKFFVGTLHAATLDTISPEKRMSEFLMGLDEFIKIHDDYGAILTYPNNDTDPTPLIAQLKAFSEKYPDRIILVPSLGMRRYLSAVALSEGVIGNSSSGVVEVASLGVPTLDIGVRQQGRERAGSVFHCEQNTDAIRQGLEHIISAEVKEIAATRQNPYFKSDTPLLMSSAILSSQRSNQTKSQLVKPRPTQFSILN